MVKAFKVYVCPILEFNSPVWSPSLSKDILLIESVQRKFTKRIPSMPGLTYYSRLQLLRLESPEIRRIRSGVLLVYRIMFGMVRLNSNEFFTLWNQPHLRGHKYVINKQRCSNNRRINFFSNRIVNLWNNLPSIITCLCLHVMHVCFLVLAFLFLHFLAVGQTLLAFAGLTSHLIMIIFYCTIKWILRNL